MPDTGLTITGTGLTITGMGAVTPVGTGVSGFFSALCAGTSGVGPASKVSTAGLRCQIVAEVGDPAVEDLQRHAGLGRASAMGLMAAREAIGAAGCAEDPSLGLVVGTIAGNSAEFFDRWSELDSGSAEDTRIALSQYPCHRVTADLASALHLTGPTWTVSNACATGAGAVAIAARMLRHGMAETVLVVGTESLRYLSLLSLDTLRVLSRTGIRPFDRGRKGTVAGEGAGALILERPGRSGVRPLAWLRGVGESCDPKHVVSPDPDGQGMTLAMERAFGSALDRHPGQGYVNAHGTGTKLNDRAESAAIRRVLGQATERTPVSSSKSMIGHTGGAAGVLEAVATACALQQQIVPPTIHLDDPDPACDLDHVPNRARRVDLQWGLSNSFGFGGINASLLLAVE